MTLRSRLALALAVVGTVILLSGVAVVVLVRASLIDEVDHQLRSPAAMVTSPTMARLRALGPPPLPLPPRPTQSPPPASTSTSTSTPSPSASATESELTELLIGELYPDGHFKPILVPGLGAGTRPLMPDLDWPTVSAHAVDHGENARAFDAASADGTRHFRVVALRIPDEAIAVLALPADRIDTTFRRVAVGMAAAGSLVLASLAVAAWWVERLGLRPIRQVTDAAGAIAGGDLDRRVDPPPAGTEAGHLARAFNVMVDERQAWEDQLRRFVADASHELRTPLTTIVGVMELHRSGSLPAGAGLDDALRRAHLEARRMAALLEDLLLLAHLDQGRPLAEEAVDLGRLARDAALDARLARPDRRITTHISPTPLVRGDESRLRQVVTNLVANAVAHTGEDAEVRVAVRPARGNERDGVGAPACVLEVADDGPGMSADQAGHVFERFYRVHAGRARRHGGSGLGLSIVQSIVTAHAGRVTLDTAPGRGATFRVVLAPSGDHFQRTSSLPCPPVEAWGSALRHGAPAARDGGPA
jgi:two-component system OmpR family sensor kinase